MSPRVNEQYKRNRKLAILQSAKNVFIKKGFVNSTMQDIILEAGISRGGLYAYFDNIEHVFEEILKLEDEKDVEYFESKKDLLFWDQLLDWIRFQQRNILNNDSGFLLSKSEYFLTNYRKEKNKNNHFILDRYNRLISSMEKFIDDGIKDGHFKANMSSKSISQYIISFFNGLILDTFNLGTNVTQVEEQIDILIFSLEKLLSPV
ncbi:TetR family transcriptional regulator [Microaceticoccus formicicus]|uniref:TetR family transcriptional regulator n=1 Tax=Microaceticoccus formicicus TaxID=3118105 RepID=UPI003CD006B3|nr:TetR family transcriptional regulator [Peptoniphilaceae bacterium AMB_02]